MSRESEYLVDRLRADINRLEEEIVNLNRSHTEVLIAEIVLAIVCGIVGYVLGAWFA